MISVFIYALLRVPIFVTSVCIAFDVFAARNAAISIGIMYVTGKQSKRIHTGISVFRLIKAYIAETRTAAANAPSIFEPIKIEIPKVIDEPQKIIGKIVPPRHPKRIQMHISSSFATLVSIRFTASADL